MTQNVDALGAKNREMSGHHVTLFCTIAQMMLRNYLWRCQTLWFISWTPKSIMDLTNLRWVSVILGYFRSPKIGCPAFLIHLKCTVERHVTHSWKKIIVSGSNHLFWSKTRLHFGSILAKISALVYGPRSQASKTPLLGGRGTPPLFKKYEIPLLSRIRISHGDRSTDGSCFLPRLSLLECDLEKM